MLKIGKDAPMSKIIHSVKVVYSNPDLHSPLKFEEIFHFENETISQIFRDKVKDMDGVSGIFTTAYITTYEHVQEALEIFQKHYQQGLNE